MGNNRTTVTILGNVVANPQELRTRQGDPFATFRVAATSRTFSSEEGWRDDETSYYGVSAFGALARNVLATLRQGTSVIVTGDLRVREWTAQDGNTRGRDVEIRADAVGPNLRFGAVALPPRRPGEAAILQPAPADAGPGEAPDDAAAAPAYVVAEAGG